MGWGYLANSGGLGVFSGLRPWEYIAGSCMYLAILKGKGTSGFRLTALERLGYLEIWGARGT